MSVYLYALLDPTPPADLGPGAWGEPLRLARCGALTALVGDLAGAPAVDAAGLRGHDAVVRRATTMCAAVLPARYGNVAEDDATLAARLAPRQPALVEALDRVRGREQMTLRVFAESSADDGAASPDPGVGPGTAWMRARARAARMPELEPVRAAVAELVLDERAQRHSTPPLYASLYHLVERGRSDDYLRALASARLDPLRAVPSGPWPAYAFAPEFEP